MAVPRSFVRLLVAAVCVLVLGGCGDPADEAGAGPGGSNDADVAFATDMIPHHREAVWMSDLAEENANDPRVLRLAKEIKYALQPEIDTMSGWLEEWGQPVPPTDATADPDPGPPSEQQLAQLEHAYGLAFDRLWLRLMLAHHQDAVAMAQTEVDEGEDGATKALAEDIVWAQRDEIERMRRLLAGELHEGGGGVGW